MRRSLMFRLLSATAAFALAAALAACDDDDVADDVRDDVEDLVTGDADVRIGDFSFSPQSITVDAGTSVTWDNDGAVSHTVTSGTPGDPTGEFSEQIAPGDSAEITFDDAGTFDYFCEIHPNQMEGTVTVG